VNSKSIPVPGMIFSVATGFVPVISKITKHENITADYCNTCIMYVHLYLKKKD
jgi:hypothetical protein